MEITAGLICNNGEIFGDGISNFSIIGGRCLPFNESPEVLLQTVDSSIDPVDHECLDQMGLVDIMDRRNQWATCNLSRLDNEPDYIYGQKTLKREFVQCSKRGYCPFESKLCRTQAQLTGLTPTQLIVLGHVHKGLLNKEIAVKMRISEETVKSHTQNIRIKTGLARKADLVRYAQKLNLN